MVDPLCFAPSNVCNAAQLQIMGRTILRGTMYQKNAPAWDDQKLCLLNFETDRSKMVDF